MQDFLREWEPLLLWFSGLSLVLAVATLVAVPWVVARLPQDYFASTERVVWRDSAREPALAIAITMVKNVVGLLLVILGVIMLVTPGQGLAMLLIGLLLMNFPGKYRFERRLVARPGVLRGLNWLRARRGRPPFDTPQL